MINLDGIEEVYIEDGEIQYKTIDDVAPKGICGSGIIDLVSTLLDKKIINRTGKFFEQKSDKIKAVDGVKRFILVGKDKSQSKKGIYITESDIENVITAKAAIFAGMKILMERLELSFNDIDHFRSGQDIPSLRVWGRALRGRFQDQNFCNKLVIS